MPLKEKATVVKRSSLLADHFGNDSLAAALTEAFPDQKKFAVKHYSDGELDDMHASHLLQLHGEVVSLLEVRIDSGNEDIYFSPKKPNDAQRLEQKLDLARLFIGDVKLVSGVVKNPKTVDKNKFTSQELFEIFTDDIQVLLNTTSMELLIKAIRAYAAEGEAKNCLTGKFIFSYDSLNFLWAIENLVKERLGDEEFKKLEQDKSRKRLEISKEYADAFALFQLVGLTHIHTDGFTLMNAFNKINSRTTPHYLDLLNHFDTPAGKKVAALPDILNHLVRPRQARKVAQIITGLISGKYFQIALDNQTAARTAVCSILKALKVDNFEDKDHGENEKLIDFFRNLVKQLDVPLSTEVHTILAEQLKFLASLIKKESSFPIIDTNREIILGNEVERPFNIYCSCAERGSALISDQIPSVIICEAAQLRHHKTPIAGIIHLMRQGDFDGLNEQGYPKYKPTTVTANGRGKCFYIDRSGYLELAQARGTALDEKTLLTCIAKGLDETFVRAELRSEQWISAAEWKKYLKKYHQFKPKNVAGMLLESGASLYMSGKPIAQSKPLITKENIEAKLSEFIQEQNQLAKAELGRPVHWFTFVRQGVSCAKMNIHILKDEISRFEEMLKGFKISFISEPGGIMLMIHNVDTHSFLSHDVPIVKQMA